MSEGGTARGPPLSTTNTIPAILISLKQSF